MSKRLHQLILTLAATGVAAGAWAQSEPDAGGGAGPMGPGGPPPHAWHGDGGDRDGPCDGRRDGEHDGDDGEHMQWGEDGGDDWHPHHHNGPGAGGDLLLRGLNLTPEQHQRIRIIVMSSQLDALKQAGTHQPGDMAALLNPGDPNYKNAVEAAKKRAADRIQRMADLKLQIYNVLTPEQKTELGKHIADWKTHMAQPEQNLRGLPAPAAR